MTDPAVDQPSPEPDAAPAPPPVGRVFAADPMERVVPVLSAQPPKPKKWTAARLLSVTRTACMIVGAALVVLFALAALTEAPDPVGTPTQSGSMRMR